MRVELFLANVPLRLQVRHALASRTANDTGFFVLTTPDGQQGIGEFIARDYVTGECDAEAASAAQALGPLLAGADLDSPVQWLEEARARAPSVTGSHTAWCGAELAVLDAASRAQGVPLCRLLERSAAVEGAASYSAVYPYCDGAALESLHERFARSLSVSEVKLKGCGQVEEDLSFLRRVRAEFPAGAEFRVDLNGALFPEAADGYVEAMLAEGVRWFEQPFPKDDLDSPAALLARHGGELTLAADESVCSLRDFETALEAGACNGVNARVAKLGGVVESLRVVDKAEAEGAQAQLGCLVGETSVLSFAGLHLAAMFPGLAHREGCFGGALVEWDVLEPPLEMGMGGDVPYSSLPAEGLVPGWDRQALIARAVLAGRWG